MDYIKLLKRSIQIADESVSSGNHPFGALLADADGNILIESGNLEVTERDCTGHAETALMRSASKEFTKDFLGKCTLVTTVEPCAMCCGAIYWGNVLQVVYGVSEEDLLKITGDNPLNPTMKLPSREIFKCGQKDIKVIGPFPEVKEEITLQHTNYWNKL